MLEVPVYWERVANKESEFSAILIETGMWNKKIRGDVADFLWGGAIGREGFTEEVTLGES